MLRPTVLDLFSGAGGLSLGFEQAGFNIVAAIEHDPVHCRSHHRNFPECRTIQADLATDDIAGLLSSLKFEPFQFDVIVGGPPCQGFSYIGKRRSDDARNDLVVRFAEVVSFLQPQAFVMENVKGLLSKATSETLAQAYDVFHSAGYFVAKPVVLNALDYGTPQSRERAFVVGTRRATLLDRWAPPPTHQRLASYLESFPLPRVPNVRDAISDLPEVDNFEELIERDEIPYDREPSSAYARVLRGFAYDPNDRSAGREWDLSIATNCKRTIHTERSKARFLATRQGDVEPISRFLKLSWDGVSNTLRAGTGTDRGSYTAPRPIHPDQPRVITVREAARLHGFPDWFRLDPTKFHGFRQVGNAVPAPLGRAVAKRVYDLLNGMLEEREQFIASETPVPVP